MTPFVQVKFKARNGPGFGGLAYTYIADVPLLVGDIVTVPTKYGDSEAMVCRVDVPEEEAARHGELKHITEPAIASDGLFDEFFK